MFTTKKEGENENGREIEQKVRKSEKHKNTRRSLELKGYFEAKRFMTIFR
jgi:hypothetical protein